MNRLLRALPLFMRFLHALRLVEMTRGRRVEMTGSGASVSERGVTIMFKAKASLLGEAFEICEANLAPLGGVF